MRVMQVAQAVHQFGLCREKWLKVDLFGICPLTERGLQVGGAEAQDSSQGGDAGADRWPTR